MQLEVYCLLAEEAQLRGQLLHKQASNPGVEGPLPRMRKQLSYYSFLLQWYPGTA